jgi:hypothetical protein
MGGVPHVRPSVRGPKKTGDPDFLWKSGGRPTTAFAIWTRKPRRCTGNDAGFFRQEREGKKPQVPPFVTQEPLSNDQPLIAHEAFPPDQCSRF